MRRSAFFFAFAALIGVACANSSTPDTPGTTVKSDAAAQDSGSGYDAGYGPVTEDSGAVADTGAITDAGKKETSTIADTGVTDTGSATVNACDTASNPAYDFQFALIVLSGKPLPPECSTGCQATECCYNAGTGMYCLPQ